MSEGELKRRLKECLRTDGKSEKLGMSGVIDEAKTEFEKIEEKLIIKINATNRDEVLTEYAQSMAACTRKWFGR